MLYPTHTFDPKLYAEPTSPYRGAPFWAWNARLNEQELLEQIQVFAEMGLGGFHMHTRVGLDTPYLGETYMEMVRTCVEEAKQKGMLAWLYDEDRWPSGYGGGLVTKDPQYRSRYLVLTPHRFSPDENRAGSLDSCAAVVAHGRGQLLAAYRVRLAADGCLADYARCSADAVAGEHETIWYAYLEVSADSPWFNNQSYVDTLNPAAIRRFIEVTHERYAAKVGEHFGQTIPAMFTDEPQFPHKQFLGFAAAEREVVLPYTDDFDQTYGARYGVSLLDHVPELLWELPDGKPSTVRYGYHRHLGERFAESFADQLGQWCEAHGMMLAGHMMEEPTLHSQTRALGEAMRSLSRFGLPGIDMLCDQREYTTAKQAQSVVHQYGRPGALSELYGVTNWDFDFRGHKLQGDWQAALGVTVRVHHLAWLRMGGEAKRDYPASIGAQSPWYTEYSRIEDHFARLNTALTVGKPLVRIGVIHPVESYWLHFGPTDQTSLVREQLENQFANITDWLLFGLLDFDYISESLLPEQRNGLALGEMDYEVVIVPGCHTLRATTLSYLADLVAAGRQVIFAGELPQWIEASEPTAEQAALLATFSAIPFTKIALFEELAPYRLLDLHYDGPKFLKKPRHKKNWDGERTQKYVYQLRQDQDNRWLFIANGRAENNKDLIEPDDLLLKLAGEWQLTWFDTMTGEQTALDVEHQNGQTLLRRRLYNHDSLLLQLQPCSPAIVDTKPVSHIAVSPAARLGDTAAQHLFTAPVQVRREEDNVLLLDLAEHQLDDAAWQSVDEVLRIDNLYRAQLGYPLRRAALAQPWVSKDAADAASHTIRLRYRITSTVRMTGTRLALEHGEAAHIWLNGSPVDKVSLGHYVDHSLSTYALPPLESGDNELVIAWPYTAKTNIESAFLLGDFDVKVRGAYSVLEPASHVHSYRSLTEIGMPFYGGNAVYETELTLAPGTYELEVSKYRAPLLLVSVNGKPAEPLIFAPYRVRFDVTPGEEQVQLAITSYGSRVNTFGAVHNCDEQEVYFDPNAWRTERDNWSYEYQLKQTGILKSPMLYRVSGSSVES